MALIFDNPTKAVSFNLAGGLEQADQIGLQVYDDQGNLLASHVGNVNSISNPLSVSITSTDFNIKSIRFIDVTNSAIQLIGNLSFCSTQPNTTICNVSHSISSPSDWLTLYPEHNAGQTFISPNDGLLTGFLLTNLFKEETTYPATINFLFSPGNNTLNPVIEIPVVVTQPGPFLINLPEPFLVQEGSTYAFSFNYPAVDVDFLQGNFNEYFAIAAEPGNFYPEGSAFDENISADGSMVVPGNNFEDPLGTDVDFIAYIDCRSIPTLSQWGIIALGMIMLIIGLVALKDFIPLHSRVNY